MHTKTWLASDGPMCYRFPRDRRAIGRSRLKSVKPLMISALVLAACPGLVLGAQPDIGKREYEANCAVCHGPEGKGDGPIAQLLKVPVPTLTTLRQENKGVFPFRQVYGMIDGRTDVAAHGPREMPVWGDAYRADAIKQHGEHYGELYAEGIIRARILALISYINRLQEE